MCPIDYRVAFCIPWPSFLGGPLLLISWYALIMVAAILIGTSLAMRHAEREGINPAHIMRGLQIALPAAVITARVVYVALAILGGEGSVYLADPLQILNLRGGGLNFFGVIAGGIGGMLVYAWSARDISPAHKFAGYDAAIMGIWLGQGLGRWNNFINRELYGPPTGSAWFGMRIPAEQRLLQFSDLARYPLETRFHPTMVYESLWLLLTFVIAYSLMRRYHTRYVYGMMLAAYLVFAGMGRFLTEIGLRPDQPRIPGTPFSFSMILALVEVAVGILLWLDRTGKLRLPFMSQPQTAQSGTGGPMAAR